MDHIINCNFKTDTSLSLILFKTFNSRRDVDLGIPRTTCRAYYWNAPLHLLFNSNPFSSSPQIYRPRFARSFHLIAVMNALRLHDKVNKSLSAETMCVELMWFHVRLGDACWSKTQSLLFKHRQYRDYAKQSSLLSNIGCKRY